MKYVKCMHDALVTCTYKDKDGKEQKKQFYPFILNKNNNQPLSTGYTKVSDEELAALRKDSKVFLAFEKMKKLVVVDEIPDDMNTPQGVIAEKNEEIKCLKEELAEAQAALKKAGVKIDPKPKKATKKGETTEAPAAEGSSEAGTDENTTQF